MLFLETTPPPQVFLRAILPSTRKRYPEDMELYQQSLAELILSLWHAQCLSGEAMGSCTSFP